MQMVCDQMCTFKLILQPYKQYQNYWYLLKIVSLISCWKYVRNLTLNWMKSTNQWKEQSMCRAWCKAMAVYHDPLFHWGINMVFSHSWSHETWKIIEYTNGMRQSSADLHISGKWLKNAYMPENPQMYHITPPDCYDYN